MSKCLWITIMQQQNYAFSQLRLPVLNLRFSLPRTLPLSQRVDPQSELFGGAPEWVELRGKTRMHVVNTALGGLRYTSTIMTPTTFGGAPEWVERDACTSSVVNTALGGLRYTSTIILPTTFGGAPEWLESRNVHKLQISLPMVRSSGVVPLSS